MYIHNTTKQIPESIGQLTKLERLMLNDNNLSGLVPETLGDLSLLTMLNLRNNVDLYGLLSSKLGMYA